MVGTSNNESYIPIGTQGQVLTVSTSNATSITWQDLNVNYTTELFLA